MAMQFYDSTNNTGLVNLFYDLTQTNTTTYPIAKVTRDINNAYANYMMLAQRASGRNQLDDTNQIKYPIVKYNITSGQRDYTVTVDGESTPNQIQEVLRVECATGTSGTLQEICPYDMTDEPYSIGTKIGLTGVPYRYDIFGGALWLDPTPNFTSAASTTSGGIWVWVNRTPSYFLSTDTTKKPGIPDQFHEYLAYRAAYQYCVTKIPQIAAGYYKVMKDAEAEIATFFGNLHKSDHNNVTTEGIRFR